MLFGIHPATAVGTDLFFAAATKSVGTLVHGLSRTVRWGIVGRLACGSVPATVLTLLVLSRFDVKGAALDQLTTQVLACSLLLTAAALIFRQQILDLYAARVGELGPRATTALTVAVGAQPSVPRSACCPACLAWSAGSQRSCRLPAAAAQQTPSRYEAERLSLERTGLWAASSLGAWGSSVLRSASAAT